MKTGVRIFFLLFSPLLLSQSITVIDEFTKEPIPFTDVTLWEQGNIVKNSYCDENGYICIKKTASFDKIEFSCIGYETKIINDFSKVDSVHLIKKFIDLNEVIISSTNTPVVLLGYIKSKNKMKLSASKGFKMAVFIENPYNDLKKIKSFLFKVKRRENYETAVRVHFYKAVAQGKEPQEEILAEDIVRVLDGKTTGMVEIDVSKYNLNLPVQGAFVGIEWLGIIDVKTGEFISDKEKWSDTAIEINDAINKPLTFIDNNGKWENIESIKKGIENYVKFKKYPNASFGIKVFDE